MANTNLLTAEEVAKVRRSGPHYPLPKDLFIVGGGDDVVITLRGFQYFELAKSRYGLHTALSKIKTKRDMHAFVNELYWAEAQKQVGSLVSANNAGSHNREGRAVAEVFKKKSFKAWLAGLFNLTNDSNNVSHIWEKK